ncbi:hypothetical protein CRG98_040072 [Punica granatum]|uniref:Uncharacterized protein n=1 Tax=Punica granatum TaxID=22663 RepID=A0A2I0I6K4_PUNGR|nr:hypothetical protein CRG98_040072 [Punica granatum]
MVWKTMFSTFIRSHYLFGFVDGSHPCSPFTDPLFPAWSRTDENIWSWLFLTLYEQILEEFLVLLPQLYKSLLNPMAVEEAVVIVRAATVEMVARIHGVPMERGALTTKESVGASIRIMVSLVNPMVVSTEDAVTPIIVEVMA